MSDKSTTRSKLSASEMFAQRKTKSVASRSDSLTDTLSNRIIDNSLETEKAPEQNLNDNLELNLQALEQELESLPTITNFQLRFEDELKNDVKDYAKKHGVTPETLLQGLWTIINSNHQDLMIEAVTEAKLHKSRRARAAELKNSITRLSKLIG